MEFNGKFKVNNELIVYPKLTRQEFSKSILYKGQDLSMYFWIREPSRINKHDFFIGFLFKDKYISQVQLYCVDDNITTEEQRKAFNENFLMTITSTESHTWGNIKSIVNRRDKTALIVINYI